MIAARRYYGLPSALMRHVIIFGLAFAAVVVQRVVLNVDVNMQMAGWLAVAVGVGVVGAFIGGGLVGAVFVVAGFVLAIVAILATQLGDTAAVSIEMARRGVDYLELIEVAALAYLITVIVRRRARIRERSGPG